MKLIRQNDESGGLVLTQNLAGKARKQNYNFGNAFSTDSVSGSLETKPQIRLPQGQTYVFYLNLLLVPNISSIGFLYADTNNYVAIVNSFGTFVVRGNGVSQQNPGSAQFDANGITILTIDVIRKKIRVIHKNRITGIEVDYTPALGLSDNYRYGATSQIATPPAKSRIDKVAVYNRAITTDEVIYMFNNALGNELLNTTSLIFETNNDRAEIFNSFVGVQDVSGNSAHQPILFLPAGTLEQQRDYANANLFKKW